MENLNAETVKEWLEICAEDTPYPDQERALHDALALINSQEQRIEELSSENKLLNVELGNASSEILRLIDREKELTEENERLHASCTELTQNLHECKADTVRKMHKAIKDRAFNPNNEFDFIYDDIDQIAKEMLEGE